MELIKRRAAVSHSSVQEMECEAERWFECHFYTRCLLFVFYFGRLERYLDKLKATRSELFLLFPTGF